MNTETGKSYVVVERDHRGWSIAGGKLYRNRVLAALAAAGRENAIVLPARRRRLHVEAFGGQPASKTFINVDWSACAGASLSAGENWYALRVAPGMQKPAKPLRLGEDATEMERGEADKRKGESIIEQRLRQEGIDVYMPAFWEEFRAHRGHKLRAKRLPLLVGYVFIRRNPGKGFDAVRGVDGVLGLVSIKQVPVVMSEGDIQFLMIKMFDQEQAFRFKRAQDAETKRFARRQTLNAELGRHLPKGRDRRKISLRAYADQCINSFPETIKLRIMGIISELDAVEQEGSLADFREPV